MLRLRQFIFVAALTTASTLARPELAAAQAAAPVAALTPASPSFGPTLASAHVSLYPEEAGPLEMNAAARRMGRREGRVFALVGGAAVIAGVLIGGDAGTVIAIGGAGLGLYGLYVWQR
jgi:hypothetical protein